jgi:PAT family beta-lactamase induction signal transducer AmpG
LAKRIVFTRRLQLLGLLSVPSGMPLGWILNAFQFFLVDLGISRGQIGLLSAVSFPWSFKVLWAPLVDRFALPWPGRRRSWVILTQLGLAAVFGALAVFAWRALAARAAGAPLLSGALLVGLLALAVAVLSATQDIAYDAYAVEFLRPEEHAAAPAVRSIYYRLGMLLAGALAASLSDWLGWPAVFLLVGAAFVACVPLVLASGEPDHAAAPPRSLRAAVMEPFLTFFSRRDALPLALFIFTYKVGDNMAGTMVNPFLRDLCFSNLEAAGAVKVLGTVTIIGATVAAAWVTGRLGIGRALWVFGVAQAAANLLYAAAAASSHGPLQAGLCAASPGALDLGTRVLAYVGISAEQGAQAMASVAQGALLLRVCDKRYAATQFALLSGLFALGRTGAGIPSGYLVEALGYPLFFTLCATVVALPGFFFLQRVVPFGQRDVAGASAPDAAAQA